MDSPESLALLRSIDASLKALVARQAPATAAPAAGAKVAGFHWDAPAKQWNKRVKDFEMGDRDFLHFKTREIGRERP